MTGTEKKRRKIQLRITKGVYSQTSIQMEKKKIQEEEKKEIGRKLEQIKKFLRMRNLKREAML